MTYCVALQEVNFALGPFALNAACQEGVDFTWPVTFLPVKVFAGRGSVEVDPWSFVLPLAPWVWLALFIFLLLLSITSYFLTDKFSEQKGFAFLSIMLRQCKYFNTNMVFIFTLNVQYCDV